MGSFLSREHVAHGIKTLFVCSAYVKCHLPKWNSIYFGFFFGTKKFEFCFKTENVSSSAPMLI